MLLWPIRRKSLSTKLLSNCPAPCAAKHFDRGTTTTFPVEHTDIVRACGQIGLGNDVADTLASVELRHDLAVDRQLEAVIAIDIKRIGVGRRNGDFATHDHRDVLD